LPNLLVVSGLILMIDISRWTTTVHCSTAATHYICRASFCHRTTSRISAPTTCVPACYPSRDTRHGADRHAHPSYPPSYSFGHVSEQRTSPSHSDASTAHPTVSSRNSRNTRGVWTATRIGCGAPCYPPRYVPSARSWPRPRPCSFQ
jgi:hypothetical protein